MASSDTKWGMGAAGYYADFVMVPLAMLAALVWAVSRGAFGAQWVAAAAVGYLGWTMFEYLVHRFVFHGENDLAVEHAKHHEHEADYIGVSTWGTVLGFAIAAAFLFGAVGPFFMPAALFGLMLGYLVYISVHDRMHHSQIGPGSWLYALKMHHVGHHRGTPGNYGVSTKLWDVVFGTIVRR